MGVGFAMGYNPMIDARSCRKTSSVILLVAVLVLGSSGVFEDDDDDENEEDTPNEFQAGGSAIKSSRNALMALSMN